MNSEKFLLKYVDRAIDSIKEKDIYEYVELINLYKKMIINSPENVDDCMYVAFQKYFCSYYNVDRPELPFKDSKEFFEFFKSIKEYKVHDIEEIIININKYGKDTKKKVYFSFATKVLAMVNDDCPIYDSRVRIALGLKEVSGKGYEERLECSSNMYKQIRQVYNDREYKKFRKKCLECFDNNFKDYQEIFEAKKVDFVLWGIGGLLRKEKNDD